MHEILQIAYDLRHQLDKLPNGGGCDVDGDETDMTARQRMVRIIQLGEKQSEALANDRHTHANSFKRQQIGSYRHVETLPPVYIWYCAEREQTSISRARHEHEYKINVHC